MTDTLARDMAVLLVAEHGDNAFAQARLALAEVRADGDAEGAALWEGIQIEVLDIGPTATMYA